MHVVSSELSQSTRIYCHRRHKLLSTREEFCQQVWKTLLARASACKICKPHPLAKAARARPLPSTGPLASLASTSSPALVCGVSTWATRSQRWLTKPRALQLGCVGKPRGVPHRLQCKSDCHPKFVWTAMVAHPRLDGTGSSEPMVAFRYFLSRG